jgi:hypothetical protein
MQIRSPPFIIEIDRVLISFLLLQVMDTPRPEQIRAPRPEEATASDADMMEVIEMVLGAMGRDVLGLGSSLEHPCQSDEWRGMTTEEKFDFFAPIWRVMRDDNMSIEQVRAWGGGGATGGKHSTALKEDKYEWCRTRPHHTSCADLHHTARRLAGEGAGGIRGARREAGLHRQRPAPPQVWRQS